MQTCGPEDCQGSAAQTAISSTGPIAGIIPESSVSL